jgi:hypothetical protein
MIPLNHRMNNGSTVSDWLGTAGIAAAAAARRIEDIRAGRGNDPEAFALILGDLDQAMAEVSAVQSACAHVAACGRQA